MAQFETGITGYVHATAKVEVFFPIDSRGNAHISCSQCYYFNNTTTRCRLTGEVCAFPNNYVGASCPLEYDENTED